MTILTILREESGDSCVRLDPEPFPSEHNENSIRISSGRPLLTCGDRIGKYELREELSQGGQGIIYRGWDHQLQRDVAFKFSHVSMDGEMLAFSEIRQEGSLLARLNHPHLAHVYDCGIHAGYPYLVLEYLPGLRLLDYAAGASLPGDRIVRILEEIADGIAAAHQVGILHLDLKPENVMVTADGHCKVIDFGLGWPLSGTTRPLPLRMMGTEEYLSPEQASGNTSRLSESTDVFGLGGILYFLLMDAAPLSPGIHDEAEVQQELEVSHRRLARLKKNRGLGHLCRKALAAHPEERIATVIEFRRILRRRRRLKEQGLAILFVLTGICLLGLGLFANQKMKPDFRLEKEQVYCGTIGNESATVTLEIQVQTGADQVPRLLLWSQRLGLQEIRGLKQTIHHQHCRWHPRPEAGPLIIHFEDELVCVAAFPQSVNLEAIRQSFGAFSREERNHMSGLNRIFGHAGRGHEFSREEIVWGPMTSPKSLSPAMGCLQQQFNALHLPYQCLVLRRPQTSSREIDVCLLLESLPERNRNSESL